MIDLHTHSNASDGTDSPKQLIILAANQGISTIALCDHDTTSRIKSFLSQASISHIRAIPAIEISAEWEKGNCHILGLNIDINNYQFQKILIRLREGREIRNELICKKLKSLKIEVSQKEIIEFAKGDVITRPHLAKVMVSKGYCKSINEAFDKFLAKGTPGYVERYRLKPTDAVEMLKESGARVFLAHPIQLNISVEELKSLVISLKRYGLDGLEVFAPYTPKEQIDIFSEICKDYGLKVSGGSDYHGNNKPGHRLGYYGADKKIPEIVEEALE